SFRTGLQIDMPLLLTVMTIATLGVVNLYSATSCYSDARANIYVSQINWIMVGMLFAIVVVAIDYRFFEQVAVVASLGGLLSLGRVFVLPTDIRGSSRWLQIASFTFQPSEFMKSLVILMVARLFHGETDPEPRTLVDLVLPLGSAVLPAIAVM